MKVLSLDVEDLDMPKDEVNATTLSFLVSYYYFEL